MMRYNNLYEKWKIDANNVEIRHGNSITQSQNTRIYFSEKSETK
jgi:hypothetical protein